MKTLKTVTDVVTLPARATAHAAAATLGSAVGAATVGLRATGELVGWAVDRTGAARTRQAASPWPTDTITTPSEQAAPAAPTPAAGPAPDRTTPAKKSPARRTPAKKAPSKKAAVVAPALGLSEAEVEGRLRTVQRAADTDQG